MWRNHVPDGEGEYHFANGDVYKGQVSQGHITGDGTMHRVDGGWYEGQFLKGNPNGEGTGHFKDGYTYQGHWDNGVPNGVGAVWAPDGKYYPSVTIVNGNFDAVKPQLSWAQRHPECCSQPATPIPSVSVGGDGDPTTTVTPW